MKNIIKTVITMIAAGAFFIPLSACSSIPLANDKNPGNQQRTFDETTFSNPPAAYRPLPIMHGGVDKGIIFKLKELGYGGLVTNVSFQEYLQNDELWKEFEENVSYAIDELGLKMWIYDEVHYPSGAAGGIVLKDNPQWQARGIVCRTAVADHAGRVEIQKPYGHDKAVAAMAYKGTSLDKADRSTKIDLMKYLNKDGDLEWDAPDGGWIAVCVYSKNFYENTHATFNWAQSRRYINLLIEDPVKEFIDVTYQKYFDHVGKYFGKGIEAFFTDEPSLLGTYFVDPPPVKPVVLDEPDPNIPLYPTVNFSDQLLEDFQKMRGYDPASDLPMLFEGESPDAKRFRWDFYKTTSELVAKNYMGQLQEFCKNHDVANSGHLLLEEDAFMHPVFEGNYLQIMKNMIYPGIDLLTSHPAVALQWACTTAKFASSAAHYDRREHVMSEVSDAFDGQKGNVEQRIGAVAVQYAMGVDHINSYYPVQQMSDDENHLFTDALGRMRYMLEGGQHVSRIAVYYPIEGIWTETLPPENLNQFNPAVRSISDNFKELSLELLGNQLDYDYLDNVNLLGCKINKGKITTPGGEQFSVLIVPRTPALHSKAVDFMLHAAENGVKVVIQGIQNILSEKGADQEKASQQFEKLLKHPNTVKCSSIYDAVSAVEKFQIRDIKLKKQNSQVIYMKKQYKNQCVYILVNTSTSDIKLNATVNEVGGNIRMWDPLTGKVEKLAATAHSDSHTTELEVGIGAERAVFITVEE